MGGKRLQEYWCHEMTAMLEVYKHFQTLIPSGKHQGADHHGEDGRYVESLVKESLKKFLPANLEVCSGFILRAGVKRGSDSTRKMDQDEHSTQLDIIIYDSANYPVYQRFGDNIIVPPEGVIAVISVKKHLVANDLKKEIINLKNVARLCSDRNEQKGPFLALITMKAKEDYQSWDKKIGSVIEEIFNDEKAVFYDEMIGYIGSFTDWSVYKTNKKDKKQVSYLKYSHNKDEEHLGLQYILNGIHDIYYSRMENVKVRPGYFAFPQRGYDDEILKMNYNCERSKYT